ncbi:unnamed protein product [Onchocerca flexuosa]|uniref:LIM zinc-binding domain-containing protein n=1 Tax=Onchocerca flexuosa TaxID=387005 RepID=A0A183H984_9BILA|nr:unnamed protein product [Onchocerca flexuosa]
MNKIIKKSLFWERNEVGPARGQKLGSKRVNLTKPEPKDHDGPLFFLTHLFCCGCYQCQMCQRNERNSKINKNNLSSSPEAISLISSSLPVTSGKIFQGSSKIPDRLTKKPKFDNSEYQRCKNIKQAFN